MKAWIGVTDWEWSRFLRERRATEVNFWQPSGGPKLNLPLGSPFLFKSKYDRGNQIIGGGFFNGWVSLPTVRAWDIFGQDNGTDSLDALRAKIRLYRARNAGPMTAGQFDWEIGCIMLRDVQFLQPGQFMDAPADWGKSIMRGKGYDLGKAENSYVEDVITRLFSLNAQQVLSLNPVDVSDSVAGEIFGDPRLSPVRLGQQAFKALVQEAYGRRCAVTGDKVMPVLQAAHIRPVAEAGENRVDNGLLLRSDVHTLFDRGYLGVHPERKTLIVSPRLRAEWGNGDEFYRREASGEPVRSTLRPSDSPHRDFLTWHMDEVFLKRAG
jgi:putative restriction endonuclease